MTEHTPKSAKSAQQPSVQTSIESRPTTHPILGLQRLIGNHAVLQRLSRHQLQRFAKQSEVRQDAFVSMANQFGLSEDAARELYSLSGGSQADPVTGFEDAADRDPTLARAITEVSKSGQAGFTAEVSIRNLGGLNAMVGHNKADAILSKFAAIVNAAMDQLPGTVSKFRQGGTELRFIIVGAEKELRQSHIEAQLMVAQAAILREAQEQGLDKIEHPKYRIDLSHKGTGITYEIHPIRSYHNAHAPSADKTGGSAPEGKQFRSAAQERRDAFVDEAIERYKLTRKQALELYTASGAAKVDTLTGFDSAADRLTTLKNAIDHVGKTGSRGFYVEVDIRNLGGVTKALGREQADGIFSRLAALTESAVVALSADVSRFRHGGDEISFILVGEAITAETVEAALIAVQTKIAAFVQQEKLSEIVHPKHPDNKTKWGTGIVFGIAPITGHQDETTDQVLSIADQQVEARKH